MNLISISVPVVQIKNGIIKHVNLSVKIIICAKYIYIYKKKWNPSKTVCKNYKYLKIIFHESIICVMK